MRSTATSISEQTSASIPRSVRIWQSSDVAVPSAENRNARRAIGVRLVQFSQCQQVTGGGVGEHGRDDRSRRKVMSPGENGGNTVFDALFGQSTLQIARETPRKTEMGGRGRVIPDDVSRGGRARTPVPPLPLGLSHCDGGLLR